MKTVYASMLAIALISFKNIQGQNKIVVGFTYEKMGPGCAMFTTAQGYRYETSSNQQTSMKDLRDRVNNRLANDYNASNSNIFLHSSTKNYGCIIKYKYKISGWNCMKDAYAVGFGDTQSEALAGAEKEMQLYYKNASYTVVTYVH